jgi:hypothetical protein
MIIMMMVLVVAAGVLNYWASMVRRRVTVLVRRQMRPKGSYVK